MATVQYQPAIQPYADSSDRLGSYKIVQGFRDGTISTTDFINRMAGAGRLITATMGSIVTPLTFLTYATGTPDALIRVPANTTIIPVAIDIAFSAMAGTVTMVDVRTATNDIANGTSSAATQPGLSSRSDLPYTTLCTARQLVTVAGTAESNPTSIFRHTYIRADDAGSNEKNLHLTRQDMKYPFLVGAASWEVFISATSTQATGFVVMSWVETPSTWWQ